MRRKTGCNEKNNLQTVDLDCLCGKKMSEHRKGRIKEGAVGLGWLFEHKVVAESNHKRLFLRKEGWSDLIESESTERISKDYLYQLDLSKQVSLTKMCTFWFVVQFV